MTFAVVRFSLRTIFLRSVGVWFQRTVPAWVPVSSSRSSINFPLLFKKIKFCTCVSEVSFVELWLKNAIFSMEGEKKSAAEAIEGRLSNLSVEDGKKHFNNGFKIAFNLLRLPERY